MTPVMVPWFRALMVLGLVTIVGCTDVEKEHAA